MLQYFELFVGFLAQVFFSARILIQWFKSEKAQRVLSPSLFWIFSIIGSYLLCLYGWMRNDFAIILGQIISYYIYLWNLKIKGVWMDIPKIIRILLISTPVIVCLVLIPSQNGIIENFFENDEIPLWLLLFGSFAQLFFTLRFIYQYFYSKKRDSSILPAGFWIISLIGAFFIIIYAIFRFDIVLVIGQSVGIFAYIRNLMILRNSEIRTSIQ